MQVRRWLEVASSFALATAALAQQQEPQPQPPPVGRPAKDATLPAHRPQPELPPLVALAHLRAGNLTYRQALSKHEPPPLPGPRPAGAGRYVAAVIVCADADVDAPYLFSLLPRDTLLLSKPGPCLAAEEVALLERAVTKERLSLIVLLTHADCESLAAGTASTPTQQALERRTQAARDLAKARAIPVDHAAALIERQAVLGASEVLRQQVENGKLLLAPGTVVPKTGLVTWLLSRAEELPLAPVK